MNYKYPGTQVSSVKKRSRTRTVYRDRPPPMMYVERGSGGGDWIVAGTLIGLFGGAGVYAYYAYVNCKWPFDGEVFECATSGNKCVAGAVRCDTSRTPNVNQKCSADGVWLDDPTGTTCESPPPESATQTFKFVYRDNGLPAPGVQVYYNGVTVLTNANGVAVFSDVPAGTQNATIYREDWHISEYGVHHLDVVSVYRPSADDYTFRTIEMEWARLPDPAMSTFKANGSPSGATVAGQQGDAACEFGLCCYHAPCQIEVVVKNRWGESIPNAHIYLDSYDGGGQMCWSRIQIGGSATCGTPVYGVMDTETDTNGKRVLWLLANHPYSFTYQARCEVLYNDPFTGELTGVNIGAVPLPIQFIKCSIATVSCYEKDIDVNSTTYCFG